MEQIVFLDRNAIRVALRPPNFPHEWREYAHTPPEPIVERLNGATIAVTNRVSLTADTIAATPTLHLVAVAATGYDHIDLAACQASGVTVCNVRDWSISVPEHVFALMLALRRQLPQYGAAIENGAWQRSPTYGVLLDPMPRALAGSVLGIIGYGALAKRIQTIGRAFGMTVCIAERKNATAIREGRTAFADVCRQSDVLVVLCPLTDETRGLIGADEITLMRPDALLINCARGGIVDEAALMRALEQGTIAGAGVDVLAQEPPRDGSPLLEKKLPNLIVTPHMAWASVESLQTLGEQLIENMEAFVAGKPQNRVTIA